MGMTSALRRIRARAQRSETGFTLLELVISLVLLTMITGAITAAIVGSFSSTGASAQRTKESNDAQIIGAFLTRDAQAAGGTDPQTGLADPTLGVSTTDTASCAVPGTLLMRFKWIDRSAATDVPNVASYSYSSGSQQISRTICVNGVGSPVSQTLAKNVVSSGSPQSPFGWCNGNEGAACPGFPDTVSLRFTESNTPVNAGQPSTYVVTASLRPQSNAQPDITASAATASLLLLGDDGDCPAGGDPSIGAQSASFSITIYGEAAIGGCATDLKKDANGFGPVFVADPGTCSDFDSAPTPSCTVVHKKFVDPFKLRIANNQLTPPPVNCGTGPPAVSGGMWQPGTYPQDPQASGTTRPFAPGVYVFCHGLTGTVTATSTGPPIGGTFFYFAGGSYTCEAPPVSPSCSANVYINPPTTTQPPYNQYNGLAIWQPQSNSGTITFNKGVANITGTVYAPSAVVQMKNGSVNINQLIAKSIDGDPGNPNVHIGPPLHVELTDPLPPGTIGQPYSGSKALALNGTGVYNTWSISTSPGGLTGLTISSTGMIGGTPSGTPGTYTVTVTVHDTDGEVDSDTAQITINPALAISGTLPNWNVNTPGYPSNPLTASGGTGGPYTWSAVGMPAGLVMDSTGTISGSPTNATTYNPAITITDSSGQTYTKTYTVTINPQLAVVSITSTDTDGTPERGDVITITFNTALNPTSVCSSWGAGANSRSATTTLVTLTKNVSGNNTLTATDAALCTFRIFSGGSLDLGSTGYVTTGGAAPKTAVFGNPSPNCGGSRHCSVIAINAADTQLTITLGDLTTGSVANVNPNPGITYTPDPALGAAGTATTNIKFF